MLCFIAGGFTLSRILKSIALTLFLKKSAPVFPFKETWGFLLRITAASALAGISAWLTLQALTALPQLTGRIGDLIKLGGSGLIFGVIYLAAAYTFKINEIHELASLIRTRLLKRSKRK
jgi:hypothetical protein